MAGAGIGQRFAIVLTRFGDAVTLFNVFLFCGPCGREGTHCAGRDNSRQRGCDEAFYIVHKFSPLVMNKGSRSFKPGKQDKATAVPIRLNPLFLFYKQGVNNNLTAQIQ
jgi:hypothetical protein